MDDQLALSITAIVISICSFGLSVYVASRDRSRLKTESHAYKHEQTGEYCSLYVKVVNAGRRPIVLTLIEGNYGKNCKCGTFINYENKGVKLEEGEFYEYSFGKHDGIMVCDANNTSGFFDLTDLWVVDSASNKYRISDAKKNIKLLRESKHRFGFR